jgi:hypothetical protein
MKMFCPKCGKGDQMPESYCRACGEWLPDLAKRGRKSFGGDSPEESLNISLFLSAITSIAALLLGIWLYAAYLGKPGVPGIIYVTAAFLLAIAGWQASNFYVGIKLSKNLARRRKGNFATQQNELNNASQANAGLPAADNSQFVRPVSSVTENTTEFLEAVPRKRTDS